MRILKRIVAFAAASVLSVTVLSSCNNRAPITINKKDDTTKTERQTGLVCWGGSMAYGAYGDSNSFMKTLEDHMMTDECYIPSVNLGVPKESIATIMTRAGVIKMQVAKKFTVPKGIEKVEITFKAEDDSQIAPLRYGTACDGGMSNVTIGGIDGILSVAEDSAQLDEPKYYFTRNKEGEEVEIKKGEQIISESMTDYTDYIPIVCIGDSSDWSSIKELIKYQQAIIDAHSPAKDGKYLVVGLFSMPLEKNDELTDKENLLRYKEANEKFDKAMEKQWGDHYVNVREYLCSDEAIEKAKTLGAEFTKKDNQSIKYKVVPDAFKYDNYNLNGYAYNIIGDIVYDKLVELGYLYH